jgi:hypothetical protein
MVSANGKSQMDEKPFCPLPLPFFSAFVRTADPEMGSALRARICTVNCQLATSN